MIDLPSLLLPKIKHFGLSVELTALRVIDVDSKKIPIHSAEVRIPDDTFQDGILIRSDVFISSLSQLVKTSKIITPYVAVCFPETFAYTREYTVPKMPSEDIQEAIAWHVKELFPFPVEDIYFDWQILQQNDTEIKTSVVAVQKKVLDPIVNAIEKAKLKPLRLEPDASALARLITLRPEEHAIMVDINPRGAYITIVENLQAIFTTVVSYSQTESTELFLKNINSTLIEINDFYKDKKVLNSNNTRIVVTGEMASNKWVNHLQSLLNYPTALLQTNITQTGYYKAYTAALTEVTAPLDARSINLLPDRIQSLYDGERRESFYKSLLIRMNIAFLFTCLIPAVLFFMLSMEKDSLARRVKSLETATRTNQPNIQDLLLLNSQAQNIIALNPFRKPPSEKIEAIMQLIPEGIELTQIDYDDSRLQFKLIGTAVTREKLLEFKEILDSSKKFSNISLPLGTLETPVQVPFIITFITKT